MRRLNLLPKSKQQELASEKLFYALSVASIIASAIVLIGILTQIGVYLYLKNNLKTVSAQVEDLKRSANKTQNAEIKKKINAVNVTLEDFANLSKKMPQWSKVLHAFVKQIPPGVKITNFTADKDKKEITIIGYSPTRSAVIDLYNNISADKEHFKDINYPLENVAQPTDVQFTFTFYIVDPVLIPEAK
jgi:Tfp pilus assembly protein PilN